MKKKILVKLLPDKTMQLYADTFLQEKSGYVGKSQFDGLTASVRHLEPILNQKPATVSAGDLQAIINSLYHRGYSKRTLSLLKSTMKSICRLAQKDGAIQGLPTEDVVIPRGAPTKEILPITLEQETLIWNASSPCTDNIVDLYRSVRLPIIRMWALLQLCCGLRREEAAALEWRDVDFAASHLHVRQAYDFKAGVIKPPKSDAGDRLVFLPGNLTTELLKWKQQHPDWTYLFEMDGKIVTEDKFRKLWDVLMDAISGISISDKIKAGCSGKKMERQHYFTSHQLRHTFATNALDAGVSLKALQYLMGHETPEMTMRYVGLTRRAMEDAREKLEKLYRTHNTGSFCQEDLQEKS